MRFWDSSAIVPLLIDQPASADAIRWATEDPELVVWTFSGVEAASALRRLVREGALEESLAFEAEALAEELLTRAHTIADIERVKDSARRLLRVHPLRAADAMQLGAALAWAGGAPRRQMLHTFDRRLADAARREGFDVLPA